MSSDTSHLNHRILVIDDMVELHQAFRRLLCRVPKMADLNRLESTLFGATATAPSPATFDVDVAAQGQQGLQLVRAALAEGRPYAVAFIDMRMPPGWDGLQTIEAIWREYPDLEVVICTAHSDYSDDDIVARLGASDQVLFLRKPFDAIEVRLLARALTEKWSLRQQARLRLAELERRVATRVRELSSLNARLVDETEKVRAVDRQLRHARHLEMTSEVSGALARELSGALQTLLAALDETHPVVEREPQASERPGLGNAMSRLRMATTAMLGVVPSWMARDSEAPPPTTTDLDNAIAEIVDLMRDGLDPRTMVEVDLQPLPLLPYAATDIKLALIGMVDNARQAVELTQTSSGRCGRISISTRLDGDAAIVTIADTGPPVPDTMGSTIFDPLFVPSDGERPGLAFARNVIVDQHGGHLAIENGANGGVTLVVRLPVQPSPKS